MTLLETGSIDYLTQYDAISVMGVTTGIMSGENTLSAALTYCQTYFPSIEGCTGKILPAGASGVPWGMVIDLETMKVTAMENADSYIDFYPTEVYNAIKAAFED
jgi:hypothetical protein